jgi:hypothetical protein
MHKYEWKNGINIMHTGGLALVPVSGHLGKNRRCRNAIDSGIALDNGTRFRGQVFGELIAVD